MEIEEQSSFSKERIRLNLLNVNDAVADWIGIGLQIRMEVSSILTSVSLIEVWRNW